MVTDQHLGGKAGSIILNDIQKKFYTDIFFPYLDKHNIKRIINLGDLFDVRKNTNTYILEKSKEFYFDEIYKRGITLDNIIGNHCTFFKNTNRVNTPSVLLKEYNFNIYDSPQDIIVDGISLAIVPWLCSENYEESLDFIKNTKSQILLGHLELQGFEMYRGSVNHHGLSASLFSKFDKVFSGHFHHKSSIGNITYLGAPYEMCWSDYNDSRGFHIFDTETRELEYIENPYKSYHKIIYNDSENNLEKLLDFNTDIYYNGYIKIIVEKCNNKLWLDKFRDKIEKSGTVDIKIIDIPDNDKEVLSGYESNNVDDTRSLLKDVIIALDRPKEEKEKISNLIESLYNEASSM